MPKKAKIKQGRWRRRLVYVGLACMLILGLLYVFRLAIFGSWLTEEIAIALAKACNAEVQIEQIDGSLLSDVRIKNLSIMAKDDKQSLQALSIKSLTLDYSFWGLLNGFDLSDIKHAGADGFDLNLQRSKNTAVSDSNYKFNPAVLSRQLQGRLPDIDINGSVQWRQPNMNADTQFQLSGSNDRLSLKCSNTTIEQENYVIGDIEIERIDGFAFRLHAPNFHRSLSIKNAQLMVTPSTIDLRLPVTIAKQRQSINYRYTMREQNMECHLDFYWDKTPSFIRSFIPDLLPVRGHSRFIVNMHKTPSNLDLNCMAQIDKLVWQFKGKDFVETSIHAFIENDSKECNIDINHVDIKAPAQHVSLSENLYINSSNHRDWVVEPCTIQTSSGAIKFGGTLSQTKSDFSCSWDKINLSTLAKAFNKDFVQAGTCNGSIYIGGDLDVPHIKADLATQDLIVDDIPFSIDLRLSQNQSGLQIEHAYLSNNKHANALITGTWPSLINRDGIQPCKDGHPAEIQADMDIPALERIPFLHGIFESGSLAGESILTLKDGVVKCSNSFTFNKCRLHLLADHDDFILDGQADIHLNDQQWTANAHLKQDDSHYITGSLKLAAPVPLFQLHQKHVEWDSFIKNAHGRIDFRNPYFQLKGSLPRIGDINGSILIDGRNIKAEQLTATLGFESLMIDGSITAGYPHLHAANVRVQGKRILLVQSPSLRLRSDANLLISKSDTQPLRISGALHIVDALYSEDFVTTNRHSPEVDSQFQLFSLPEAALGGAELDIRVSAQRSIRIRNSMLRADASGELRIRGTAMVPEPAGDVLIHEDNARLTLPFSTIWFNPSTITFKASDPFNPSFFISGTTKMQGYDMRVLLEGTMSNFSVNDIDIISNPPLSPEEATRLITTGIPPRNIFDAGNDIDTSGLVIGWAIVETLRKILGRSDPDKEKFINNIEVQIGRGVSDNGFNTIEVTAPFGEHFFIKVERDKYEDFNADVGVRKEW